MYDHFIINFHLCFNVFISQDDPIWLPVYWEGCGSDWGCAEGKNHHCHPIEGRSSVIHSDGLFTAAQMDQGSESWQVPYWALENLPTILPIHSFLFVGWLFIFIILLNLKKLNCNWEEPQNALSLLVLMIYEITFWKLSH